MVDRVSRSREVLQCAVLLAAAPSLIYCAGLLYFFEGRLPWPGRWLVLVALTGAGLGLAVKLLPSRGTLSALCQPVEPLVRYVLALLLFQYALNKLIPGQFLLYNRDLDLAVHELPARKLAWHFLGYSRLYNGFIASVELAGAVLLCSRRTVRAGVLLSLAALSNIVVVDVAFGLRGALPIATTMLWAALALAIVHLDWPTLQSLVWRGDDRFRLRDSSVRGWILWLATLTLVIGFPLYKNLETRRGLAGQVAPAGRWEVLDCVPPSGIALCRSQTAEGAAVLYVEIGQWGQLVMDSERRNASFTYDRTRGSLEIRIGRSTSTGEPEVVLTGTVQERDTIVTLDGRAAGVPPFQVRLQRTRPAPWPPVRAF